ncbi:MAG: DUF4293 family protein [Cytophagales bacterium]|nr:MAG: DUF4293 family protein [Cytophagales bacterium]
MWQRVQTLFLVLVAVCMIAAIFSTVWHKENPNTNEMAHLTFLSLKKFKGSQPIAQIPTFYAAILAFAAAAVALYSTTRYDNRLLQMKLGFFNTLLLASTLGLSVYFAQQAEQLLIEPQTEPWRYYQTGFYLPVIAMMCNLLANRFIRRDEMLVRSMDRIR